MQTDVNDQVPDIFLSYAREDRTVARELVREMEHAGWKVWWDPEIRPGQDFELEIDLALARARAVVVLWSRSSVASNWVRNEAKEAKDQNKLIPLLLDDSRIPLSFRSLSTIELKGWPERPSRLQLAEFKAAVARVIQDGGRGPVLRKPDPSDALSLSVRVASRVAEMVSRGRPVSVADGNDRHYLQVERCITDICLDLLGMKPQALSQQINAYLLNLGRVLHAEHVVSCTVDFSRLAVSGVRRPDGAPVADSLHEQVLRLVNDYCSPLGEHNLNLTLPDWSHETLLCLPLARRETERDFAWFIAAAGATDWSLELQNRLLQLSWALHKVREQAP